MVKRIVLLLVCSMVSVPLYSYACGYTRLYRADNDMTVDIVYDVHFPEKHLSWKIKVVGAIIAAGGIHALLKLKNKKDNLNQKILADASKKPRPSR